jgi:hypothetical protein
VEDVMSVYGWRAGARWALLVAIVVATLIIVPMLVGLAVSLDTVVAGLVILAALAAWVTIVGVATWRLALTLEVGHDVMRWCGAVRQGTVQLNEVQRIAPVRILSLGGVHSVLLADGRAVWVLVAKGFDELVEDLREDGRQIEVRLSAAVGSAARMPGRNQYRRI